MVALFEILVAMLAVVGVYAIFSRFAAMLTPADSYTLALDASEREVEDILIEAELLRLKNELYTKNSRTVVLLDTEDGEKENALRSEGFLVYVRK